MANAVESLVQVAPDSTGKKIRNLQLDVVQADGTTATVQLQVASIADAYGNLLDVQLLRGASQLSTIDDRVLEQLTEINASLSRITQMLSLEFEQSTEGFDVEN